MPKPMPPKPKPDNNDMINRGALPDKPIPTGPSPGPKVPKPPKKFASGGAVRGAGCATKGRGKGRFI